MVHLRRAVKRSFDIGFSILLLVGSSPFLLLAALIIKLASPREPVIFRQRRVGYFRKEFTLYKLRSMTSEKDPVTRRLLPDEQRLKLWGRIIRKTNLDEVPQAVNVLKGEMSLIGPRPLLLEEMQIMSEEEQEQRQSMRPGISGWEAVNEAKAITRREKADYDLYYIDHWSLRLDVEIFFRTLYVIFANKRPDDSVRAPKLEKE